MIAYRPRFKRRDDGGYDASLGRGSKKIKAVVRKTETGWTVGSGDSPSHLREKTVPKLKTLKEDWSQWAEQKWEERFGGPPVSGPPRHAPTQRSGPPRHTPGPATARDYDPALDDRPIPPDLSYREGVEAFNPRHKYGFDEGDVYKRKQLTPLGVVIETLAWIWDNPDYARHPKTAPVLKTVEECVRREHPEIYEFLKKQRLQGV